MNSFVSSRVLNPLLSLLYLATIVSLSIISIHSLYEAFKYMEVFFQLSQQQAEQYFTQLIQHN